MLVLTRKSRESVVIGRAGELQIVLEITVLEIEGGHAGHNGHAVGMENGNGRSLLKQVRAHVVAAGRPRLREIVEQATGVALVSVHHDISTLTGEEVIVFSLATPPACRAKRNT